MGPSGAEATWARYWRGPAGRYNAAMKLVIVESPNKTRKIRAFLGSDYQVCASFGHVRDLPASGDLAVAFSHGRVLPAYQPLERSRDAISELTRQANRADEVLLATDPDREGEAIAWHIAELLGARTYRRVAFHAITKEAVLAAVAQPRLLDHHLVAAQQARRVLDRVVGWLVSPTLRRVAPQAKSAGRVQSVALRLVAEREQEIARFHAVDYLILSAELERPGTPPPFTARLVTWKGEPLGQRLTSQDLADKSVAWCRRQTWRVSACERRDQSRNPPPPFITATVQQAASVRLKLNPDATMALLQSLFEDGHITYHRTDSVALSTEAIASARALIAAEFPAAYLPSQPIVHQSKAANAQEAHEAIRPTHPESGPDGLADTPAGRIYRLIWQRFIASQMANGRDQLTTILVDCAPGTWLVDHQPPQPMGVFQAKGKVVLFDGWRRLTGEDATEESVKHRARGAGAAKAGAGADEDEFSGALPMLTVGDLLAVRSLEALNRTTKPPARFTQASLIKRLEQEGIGRPSTYAAIMRTILERGYVEDRKRKLHATDLGIRVTEFLIRQFTGNFIDMGYTARLESDLDRIARGEGDWERIVTDASCAVLALAQAAGLRGNPLQPTGNGPAPQP
jgi:DNA topoisomerase-1